MVDLAALTDHVTAATDHGRAIHVHTPGPLPVRILPEVALEMLTHLLRHALTYGPPNTPGWLEVSRVGDRAVVVLEDHGPALVPSQRAHLFDPFTQVRSAPWSAEPNLRWVFASPTSSPAAMPTSWSASNPGAPTAASAWSSACRSLSTCTPGNTPFPSTTSDPPPRTSPPWSPGRA